MPGPGHYAPPDKSEAPAVISSFVSQSRARSEPVKRKRKRKDDTPGPGAYYSDERQPSMRQLHPELQYFGSTEPRFKSERNVDGPGPGAYVPRQRVMLKSSFNGSERFPEQKAATMPGPGAYDPSLGDGKTGPAGTLSLLGSTGRMAFGSHSTKRGIGGEGSLGPGPGAYEGTGKADDGRQRKSVRPPQAPHKEVKVDRDAFYKQPDPGAYNPVHPNDVGAVMRVPPRGEGFLSSGQRSDVKAGIGPGPGEYKADPGCVTGGKRAGTFNRTAIEGAPEVGKPRGLGFESQAQRFPAASKHEKMPGPGAYAPKQEWTKKNYSVLFGDI